VITSVSKIMKLIAQIAPFETADHWDNVGLLIGNPSKPTTRILIALDLSDDVLEEALEEDIDLIITHHPVIFSAMKSITTVTPLGKRIYKCIENGISVISAHTNLDRSFEHGINRFIADSYELSEIQTLVPDVENIGYGIVGLLDESMSIRTFLDKTKEIFKIEALKTTPFSEDRLIKKVAISSGASADFIKEAIASKADVFILGDLKYHEAQAVEHSQLILIDVGHYESEVVYLESFKMLLDDHIMTQGYDVMTMVSERSKPILWTIS